MSVDVVLGRVTRHLVRNQANSLSNKAFISLMTSLIDTIESLEESQATLKSNITTKRPCFIRIFNRKHYHTIHLKA